MSVTAFTQRGGFFNQIGDWTTMALGSKVVRGGGPSPATMRKCLFDPNL